MNKWAKGNKKMNKWTKLIKTLNKYSSRNIEASNLKTYLNKEINNGKSLSVTLLEFLVTNDMVKNVEVHESYIIKTTWNNGLITSVYNISTINDADLIVLIESKIGEYAYLVETFKSSKTVQYVNFYRMFIEAVYPALFILGVLNE